MWSLLGNEMRVFVILPSLTVHRLVTLNWNSFFFFDPSLKTTVLDFCSKLFTMSSLPFSSLFKQYLFLNNPYSIQYPSENLIRLSLWRLNVSIPPVPTVCFLNLQYNFYNHWLYSWNDLLSLTFQLDCKLQDMGVHPFLILIFSNGALPIGGD